jgi:flavoprotein
MSLATRPSPAAVKRARKLSLSIYVLPVDDQIGLIEKGRPNAADCSSTLRYRKGNLQS